MDLPEGLTTRPLTMTDSRAVFEVMAAQELAEVGEVLPHLGVVDPQGRTEASAGDRRQALALGGLELPQVEAHPAHDGAGGQPFPGRYAT